MNTTKTLHRTPLIDFGIQAPNLLDQLDERIEASMLSRAAVAAYDLFANVTEQSAEDQAALVSKLSASALLRNVVAHSVESVAFALAAAALLTATRGVPATASERVKKALTLLSDRYQADW
jgi:hypothetical protein